MKSLLEVPRSPQSVGLAEYTERSLRQNKLFQERWYHSIELLPGLFTSGYDFNNIALTRELLKGCEIENMSCLDVGARDCLITLLMIRRGARNVAAYDRQIFASRIDLLKRIFGVDFNYLCGMKLSELRGSAKTLRLHPFDLVVFSGVLYHMFDPLAGLARVRGLVRNGGLMLIETSAVFDNSMAMYFNAGGRFYPRTNYWQISIGCLDYLLRFLRFEVLDCIYLKRKQKKSLLSITRKGFARRRTLEVGRIAAVCRAVNDCLPNSGDSWMGQSEIMTPDFSEFLDWAELQADRSPIVDYKARNERLRFHQDTGSVNLYETVQASQGLEISNPDEQIRLTLTSTY